MGTPISRSARRLRYPKTREFSLFYWPSQRGSLQYTNMVLSIPITPDTEAKLRAQAAVVGVDVETFAARTLERVASRPPLDELLAPLRAEFDASGMTDEQLADLLEQAKHEMRAERRARHAS